MIEGRWLWQQVDHLQCSGIDYAEDEYYDTDIENKMFFAKNVNKSLGDVCIFCEVISCEVINNLANLVLKYIQRRLSYNFIALKYLWLKDPF